MYLIDIEKGAFGYQVTLQKPHWTPCSSVVGNFFAWSKFESHELNSKEYKSPPLLLVHTSTILCINHSTLSKRPQQMSADKIYSRKFQTFDATVSNCKKFSQINFIQRIRRSCSLRDKNSHPVLFEKLVVKNCIHSWNSASNLYVHL